MEMLSSWHWEHEGCEIWAGGPWGPLQASAGEMKEQGWAIAGSSTASDATRALGRNLSQTRLSGCEKSTTNQSLLLYKTYLQIPPKKVPLKLLQHCCPSLNLCPVLEASSNVLEITLWCFPVCAGLSFSSLLSSPPVAWQREERWLWRSAMLCDILLRVVRRFAA